MLLLRGMFITFFKTDVIHILNYYETLGDVILTLQIEIRNIQCDNQMSVKLQVRNKADNNIIKAIWSMANTSMYIVIFQ